MTVFSGKKFCGKKLPGQSSTFKSLNIVKKGTKDCKAFVTSQIPKWSLCNSLGGGKVCAAGPACPVNSISTTSFGAKDKNEKVVSVGTSKLYLSSVQPSNAVTKLTV